MRVKAVNHVEMLCVLGGLCRQIGRAAAAEHHHINLILPVKRLGERHNRNLLRVDLDARRVAPRKDGDKLQVLALLDCALNASAQISVAQNADACLHSVLLSPFERPN